MRIKNSKNKTYWLALSAIISLGLSSCDLLRPRDLTSESTETSTSEDSSTSTSSSGETSTAVPTSEDTSTSSSSSESQSEEVYTTLSFVLDEENGPIDSDYVTEEQTNSSGKDAAGESFPIVYSNATTSHDAEYGYAQLKRSSGYLYSTVPLNLKSITVNYKSGGTGGLYLTLGNSTEELLSGDGPMIKSGEEVEILDGQTLFHLEAGKNVIYIGSIQITYEGKGTPSSSSSASSSTSQSSSTSSSESSSSSEDDDPGYAKHYISDASVKVGDLDYYCPSTGDIKVLVIPVDIKGYEFTSDELEELAALTGGEVEDTSYWESLGSFYRKSSYGKLNFSFEVAPVYKTNQTPQEFYDAHSENQDWAESCIRAGVQAYKAANGNASTKKFDSNSDGLIDATIAIYSCPNDYDSEMSAIDSGNNCFWAYQFFDYDGVPEDATETSLRNSPIAYTYFWASFDFFFEGVGSRSYHTGIDAHTLIHEMGHALGADDYYNTYTSRQTGGEGHETYEPSGNYIMMASNILDHDIYSKMMYGWVDPYVPYDSCEITLSPTESSGDCILLSPSWNGTAYDEYLMLEFYTPTGLNELDSSNYYGSIKGPSTSGIRVWHVDSRLCKCTGYSNSEVAQASSFYSETEIKNGNLGNGYSYFPLVAARNSAKYDASLIQNKGYELLQYISPKKTKFTDTNGIGNNDLFTQGQTFSWANYSSTYFNNSTKMNNGKTLGYSFTVKSISSTSATIQITKA